MMPVIRVLLADDHVLVRTGIRMLLQKTEGVEVVGEADDGRRAVALALELRPHIVLMDISMPNLNGLEAAAQIRRECPEVRVIILSMSADETHVLQALRAGASGYLLKDASPDELTLALQSVMRGDTWLTPRVSRQVVEGYVGRLSEGETTLDALTPRQREILQLIAEGQGTKEIAFKLGLSVKTVETHRAQIMDRLNIRDVPGLVRFAVRSGLVSSDR
jgi:DNA-binding NarL/FixJ family response regulator